MSLANRCSRYVAGRTAGGTSLQRIVEQNVAIPVLGGGGRLAGSSRFSSRAEFSSARSFLRNVFLSGLWSRSLTFLVGIFEFLALCRVRQRHLLLSLPLVRMMTRMSLVKVFLTLFPTLKKVRRSPGTRVLGDVSSSTLSAHQMAPAGRLCFGARISAPRWLTTTGVLGCVWTLRGVRIGRTWTLGTHSGVRPGSTEVPQIQFIDFMVVEAEREYIIVRQSTEAFGGLSFSGFARAVRTWKYGALFLHDLVSGCFFVGVWVLHVDRGTLDSSGDDFVRGVMLGLTGDTGPATVLFSTNFTLFLRCRGLES